jgi:hypothetical protein
MMNLRFTETQSYIFQLALESAVHKICPVLSSALLIVKHYFDNVTDQLCKDNNVIPFAYIMACVLKGSVTGRLPTYTGG